MQGSPPPMLLEPASRRISGLLDTNRLEFLVCAKDLEAVPQIGFGKGTVSAVPLGPEENAGFSP